MAKIGRSNDRRNTPVALSDAKIKALKPRKAMYKVFDTGRTGLHIVVNTNGSRLWRMRYWFEGKEKTYSIVKVPHPDARSFYDLRLTACVCPSPTVVRYPVPAQKAYPARRVITRVQ